MTVSIETRFAAVMALRDIERVLAERV
ncbi:protein of unknown function (plasmid) [Pararobbsia alpina]